MGDSFHGGIALQSFSVNATLVKHEIAQQATRGMTLLRWTDADGSGREVYDASEQLVVMPGRLSAE